MGISQEPTRARLQQILRNSFLLTSAVLVAANSKIDGTIVRDMHQDRVDAAMVEAIHKVARLMGVRTVAKYVKDEASALMLWERGIDYAQGYHVHPPQPLCEICAGEDQSG